DEYLNTIPEKESNEVIKSSVENLVPIPRESEVTSDNESKCDVPVDDESSSTFTTFSNPLLLMLRSFFSKIDSLLEQFFGELAHNDLIPPGINEDNLDPEGDIRLVERLLYDNSSPRPPKELNSTESFPPSPIPITDSDSLMEEIDLFLVFDDSIPPGIDNDYSDSEGDNLFLRKIAYDDPHSLRDNPSLTHVTFPLWIAMILTFTMYRIEFVYPSSPIR
ncbi:hypothetical protein Tco_0920262, partial [Tanacetum coccineum]